MSISNLTHLRGKLGEYSLGDLTTFGTNCFEIVHIKSDPPDFSKANAMLN